MKMKIEKIRGIWMVNGKKYCHLDTEEKKALNEFIIDAKAIFIEWEANNLPPSDEKLSKN